MKKSKIIFALSTILLLASCSNGGGTSSVLSSSEASVVSSSSSEEPSSSEVKYDPTKYNSIVQRRIALCNPGLNVAGKLELTPVNSLLTAKVDNSIVPYVDVQSFLNEVVNFEKNMVNNTFQTMNILLLQIRFMS